MGAIRKFFERQIASAIAPILKSYNFMDLAEIGSFSELIGAETSSGNRVNAKTALQVTTALACTRAIAEGISQVPLRLMKRTADGKGANAAVGHPLYMLLAKRPNDWQTWFEFIETLTSHAVITHGGFAFKTWSSRGTLLELIPIVPGAITVQQKPDYSIVYKISDQHGHIGDFGPKDILHLRGPSWDSVVAWDVTRLARNAIGLAAATEESQARVHANGGRVAGILSADQAINADAMKRLREVWAQTYGGPQNSGKTAILDNGMKYTPMAQTFVEMQTLEARKLQVEEVCRAFMVYPAIIGHADKTSTFASAEQFFQAHIRHTLQPWARRWEQKLGAELLTDAEIMAGYFFDFDLDQLQRGDMLTRAKFYQSGIQAGWLVRNEARQAERKNPLDGLDEPLKPLNMVNGDAPDPDATADGGGTPDDTADPKGATT